MFINDANNFIVDKIDHMVPDHNFLFPEFEIVTETEDEILPEVVEMEDYSEVTGSMGKESVHQFYSTMTKYTLGGKRQGGKAPSVCICGEAENVLVEDYRA
jgi:hypothetical protein